MSSTTTTARRTLVMRPGTISGTARVPGDKSLSHRGLIVGAIASGRTNVSGLAGGLDVRSTAGCLRALGVAVEVRDGNAAIDGRPPEEWGTPASALDCGNSGTTMRVLAGLLARSPAGATLDGDDSLRGRPMDRVCRPLEALGAATSAREGRFPPLHVRGGSLRGARVATGVASAQVKTAAILAALGADGASTIVEPAPTRDHTERMLAALGGPVASAKGDGSSIEVTVDRWSPPRFDLDVAGDPSSSAFLVTAALLTGEVAIEDVCLNPIRIAFLDAARRMGADTGAETREHRLGEPVGRIHSRAGDLESQTFDGPGVAALVDELPLLAVLATQARGRTIIRDAAELRVKESDRITAITAGLRVLGAEVTERPDGLEVAGPTRLRGGVVHSAGDHRIAMALAVAGLACQGEVRVEGFEAADVSWPGFDTVLASLGADCRVEVS